VFQKILLAADGSEHAIRAAEKAIAIAKHAPDANITIVFVADPDETKHEVLENWNHLDLGAKRKARLQPIESLIEEADITKEVVMLHGKPGPAIVEYVNRQKFDLVVIGSRGLNTLQEFVLGSVSHKVAKRAHCPVLIVK